MLYWCECTLSNARLCFLLSFFIFFFYFVFFVSFYFEQYFSFLSYFWQKKEELLLFSFFGWFILMHLQPDVRRNICYNSYKMSTVFVHVLELHQEYHKEILKAVGNLVWNLEQRTNFLLFRVRIDLISPTWSNSEHGKSSSSSSFVIRINCEGKISGNAKRISVKLIQR